MARGIWFPFSVLGKKSKFDLYPFWQTQYAEYLHIIIVLREHFLI